ncbi:hypothetical protein [Actinoplanes sp. NPDC026619]|uniref:hypothetical protein n=1 Tax=Actinoplanes sp. NPDC026619 TaxID=3155798 RepID=UPI0033F6BBD1
MALAVFVFAGGLVLALNVGNRAENGVRQNMRRFLRIVGILLAVAGAIHAAVTLLGAGE